ncbi:HIT family protein [Rhodovibrio sodomensis]|uniref:HIT family protein n=1 Tax=Rhodovibrio sodomensis TaxID=1088 RepID=A0ABS1DKA9_9PROT|nr:HIT domain-containing protein [Rhodovibrio sodomensis]MBK1670357.1 HIT family protein [Rhodovibrio sodomensis]
MAHATMTEFGYPDTVIADYTHWTVQRRPRQATLGALVMIAKAEATAFAQLPDAAFAEAATVVRAIERALSDALAYDKINYLMLMMKDPHVHYHVLPRYAQTRVFDEISCSDPGWPGPPDLAHSVELPAVTTDRLHARLVTAWPD